ncbi:universal stress protein [Mucilaginibacter polytrichastri]|uniref:UspA domain-containing protein n=1 Tax=Mucilaginibacter polytrichastri TaxID=1302689 RepID=A0A1Q5ZYK9_9SPHI|nr:universal stress protein [Mucilaginibacter polytrichastri]OKS86850.1 hypothetical protein RG47T_2307 [Mucilaginibacter polytrichastri]SFT17443.1 Nucleotide-binding universal stress protein, UspA family [Mucilaginibacter polytrichastri]
MKTLLIATDFSANARHAADYGYNLAKHIKANVLLCNAVMVPSEIPQAGGVVWPAEEYDLLMDDSAEGLKQLRKHLEHKDYTAGFHPAITCTNSAGTVTDVVNNIISTHEIEMVVSGTHGSSSLSQFLLGNHSKAIINGVQKPVLLIPHMAVIEPVKKIAFAVDFEAPEKDVENIYALIPLAKRLNAEILITHVYKEKYEAPAFKQWIGELLTQISNKANYPNIYYRVIKSENTENGLNWLCAHGQIDMLAMIHRPHNFFENIFEGSHTQKMAGHINIPLLVFSSLN